MRAIQELRAEVAALRSTVARLEEELREARAAPAAPATAADAEPPAATEQCAALTQKGARCTRKPQAGGKLCWQHAR